MDRDELRRKLRHMWQHQVSFAKWVAIACLVGAVVGLAGTAFSFSMKAVTGLRTQNPLLLYLLPAAGLVIVFLYRACKVTKSQGTNLVIISVRSKEEIPLKMAPLIFLSTVLTHLAGGSAGREGAALQLGGSLGQQLGRWLHLDHKDLRIITMCGMSAAFSALFGTPLTAAVFSMEVVSVGVMYYSALVPCALASLIAGQIARAFGSMPEAFPISTVPVFELLPILRVLALAVLCAGISVVFCKVMRAAAALYEKLIPNQYLRIFVGGSLVVMLALLFGRDYLGSGMEIIGRSMRGQARPEAFLLKLIFTAVTLGAGYKGGEIVPCFFVGATFGCFAGGLLGLPPAFGAAIGMMSVFCGVTNCPVTSLLLSFELFGFSGAPFFLVAAAVSYMLSGYYGLYTGQKILYSKFSPSFIDKPSK